MKVTTTTMGNWIYTIVVDSAIAGTVIYSYFNGDIPILTTFVFFWLWLAIVLGTIVAYAFRDSPLEFEQLREGFKEKSAMISKYHDMSGLFVSGLLVATGHWITGLGFLWVVLQYAGLRSECRAGKYDA